MTIVHRKARKFQIHSRSVHPSVSLIGYGNWGTSLAAALSQASVPIQEIIVRQTTRRKTPIAGATLITLAKANLCADLFWICTGDHAISETANQFAEALARKPRRRKQIIVFHSSGALLSTELVELKKAGASVASVHPLMTFPRRQNTREKRTLPLAGVPFAIEGDAVACQIAKKLVRAIGGMPFTIEADDKKLYHVFGMFASPLLTTLLTATVEAGVAAGFTPREAKERMQPIVERTVENFFDGPSGGIFSGPIARGDAATIAQHIKVLRAHPQLLRLYQELAKAALESLPAKNNQQIKKALAGS